MHYAPAPEALSYYDVWVFFQSRIHFPDAKDCFPSARWAVKGEEEFAIGSKTNTGIRKANNMHFTMHFSPENLESTAEQL